MSGAERPERPSELLLDAAARLRAHIATRTGDSGRIELIQFMLGRDRFAMAIELIGTIERLPALTLVPNTPPFVAGIANLRGEIVPVLDLAAMLELEEEQRPRGLLVLRDRSHRFGIITHSLPDILKVSPEDIEPSPRLGDALGSILSGVLRRGDQIFGVIDLPRLLTLVARLTHAE
jgi:purine-binding chemotaxis protein CheW